MKVQFHVLAELQQKSPNMALYALVDAALAEDAYTLLKRKAKLPFKSLFDDTPDQSSFIAAPLLVQIPKTTSLDNIFLTYISEIESTIPAVNWLFSEASFKDIYTFLQKQLYVVQPNKPPQLFRFYDVRHMSLAFEHFSMQYQSGSLKNNINKLIPFYMTKYKQKEYQFFQIDELGKMNVLDLPIEVQA